MGARGCLKNRHQVETPVPPLAQWHSLDFRPSASNLWKVTFGMESDIWERDRIHDFIETGPLDYSRRRLIHPVVVLKKLEKVS